MTALWNNHLDPADQHLQSTSFPLQPCVLELSHCFQHLWRGRGVGNDKHWANETIYPAGASSSFPILLLSLKLANAETYFPPLSMVTDTIPTQKKLKKLHEQ